MPQHAGVVGELPEVQSHVRRSTQSCQGLPRDHLTGQAAQTGGRLHGPEKLEQAWM